jgi:phosphate transport system substrate-binding protein
MKKTLRGTLAVTFAAGALLSTLAISAGASITSDISLTSAQQGVSFSSDGSSFDEPFFNSAIPVYLTESGNTKVGLYNPVGSTQGKKDVSNDVVQLGASDVPLGQVSSDFGSGFASGDKLSNYVQVPVVFGGVALMYNLPSITKKFPKYPVILNASTLAGIYAGKITTWNSPSICALNPRIVTTTTKKVNGKKKTTSKCALPSTTIVPVYRADGSGTSYIFMDYLHTTDPSVYTTSPSTTFPSPNSNSLGAQKNFGVANTTETTPNSIGYVEYSYVLQQHTLPAARIVNAAKQTVTISSKSISADLNNIPTPSETNGAVSNFSAVNGSSAGAYPIAGFSWAIVRADLSTDSGFSQDQATVLVKFLDWAVQSTSSGKSGGQNIAAEEGYVPLPSKVVAWARNEIQTIKYNGNANFANLGS